MDAYDIRAEGRFESRVDRSGGSGSCHPWTGSCDKQTGYGDFWYRGRTIGAHRYAWQRKNGPIPEGMSVLHRCDIRKCVNDTHLDIGSQADNMRDRIAHGAGYARGEAHSRSRLTEKNLQIAAALRRDRKTWKEIAELLGVARSTISRSVQHQSDLWSHVEVGVVPSNLGITDEMLDAANQLHDEGMSWTKTAAELGVTRQGIRYALRTRSTQ